MAEIIEISDLGDPRLDAFVRLTGHQLRNKLEPEAGVFIVESPIAIEAAFDAGCEPLALLTEERYVHGKTAGIIERVGNVPVYAAPHDVLAGLTGFELTRGVLCAMKRPAERDWRELCKSARRVAVLENIVDTTNLGAIFRCAAGLGIDAVLLSPECCDPLCRRAVRVSMGTVLMVPFARIGCLKSGPLPETEIWPGEALKALKREGFVTVAMALRNDTKSIDDPSLKEAQKLAILLGNEGRGLSEGAVRECDFTVRIPMSAGVDSLNVAAAAAIAFFSFRVPESEPRT
ncbi:MAG: RNA methyltransferase [Clostridia bacterium]|nr:RNA methyltransferase [Clostridia bacterium]